MANLPFVSEESDDPVVQPVFARMRQRWGMVLRLYRILAWSPPLVKAWSSFAWSMRFELSASRKLRELMVIRIAQILGARYEYGHHLHMARDEGITERQVAALALWRESDLFDREERMVLSLADELASSPGATAATMASLRAIFSEQTVVELLVTGSFYCGVSRIVNSLDLDLEDNHDELRACDH